MHTEDNTDIQIIINNCKANDLADKDNNCVLIITGSLNPVHRSHIKNLLLVKTYLENHKTRPMNVLAAYLSPTHDSYVRRKLGEVDWIPAHERSALCKKAIEAENQSAFISVAEGELRHDQFVDFNDVTIALARFLNSKLYKPGEFFSHPLKVVYVCGLDHFNKCPYVEQLAAEKNIACAVVYRLGAPDNRIKRLQEHSSNVYYITLEDERETLVDISSTEIRKRYRSAVAQSEVDQIAYPFVVENLKGKYSKK